MRHRYASTRSNIPPEHWQQTDQPPYTVPVKEFEPIYWRLTGTDCYLTLHTTDLSFTIHIEIRDHLCH